MIHTHTQERSKCYRGENKRWFNLTKEFSAN